MTFGRRAAIEETSTTSPPPLADIDGLYTTDPTRDPGATLVPEVHEITPEIEAMAGTAQAGYASGGMVTKLAAAKVAMAAGCRMVIADGKAEFAIKTQNYTAMGDSLTQCRFTSERGYGAMVNDKFAKLLNLVTGWDTTAEELEETGERICNLERAFQVREGVDRSRDMLPHRVMHEPIPDGPHKGMHCPPEELERMKDEYYELRGWDERGIPTEKTLTRLGLNNLASEGAPG